MTNVPVETKCEQYVPFVPLGSLLSFLMPRMSGWHKPGFW